MKKNVFNAAVLLLVLAFIATGCAEQGYYRQNHRHTDGYYQRRHMTPPVGVELDIRGRL